MLMEYKMHGKSFVCSTSDVLADLIACYHCKSCGQYHFGDAMTNDGKDDALDCYGL